MANEPRKPDPQDLVHDHARTVKGSQSGNKTSENVQRAIEAVKKAQEKDK